MISSKKNTVPKVFHPSHLGPKLQPSTGSPTPIYRSLILLLSPIVSITKPTMPTTGLVLFVPPISHDIPHFPLFPPAKSTTQILHMLSPTPRKAIISRKPTQQSLVVHLPPIRLILFPLPFLLELLILIYLLVSLVQRVQLPPPNQIILGIILTVPYHVYLLTASLTSPLVLSPQLPLQNQIVSTTRHQNHFRLLRVVTRVLLTIAYTTKMVKLLIHLADASMMMGTTLNQIRRHLTLVSLIKTDGHPAVKVRKVVMLSF
jgi:hypothetical protein